MSTNGNLHWHRNHPTRTAATNSRGDVSACLLVMDDNHFAIEWIAYHYHALQLRTLIVATDPTSRKTPHFVLQRWKDRMHITEWTDEDYMSEQEFQDAQRQVREDFGEQIPQRLVQHRARQRIYYDKCLRTLKQQKSDDGQHNWVLLTDTDEFLRINFHFEAFNSTSSKDKLSLEQPGTISRLLHPYTQGSANKVPSPDSPLPTLQSSPCIQVPRLRFDAQEQHDPINVTTTNSFWGSHDYQKGIPTPFHFQDFVTLRWRHHAPPHDYHSNKISKALVDLSRIPMEDILLVDSIHLPIRSVCHQRGLHIRAAQSPLIINHYLGSAEQYTYRDLDARLGTTGNHNERSLAKWQSLQKVPKAQFDDTITPWLQGFISTDSVAKASELLRDIGKLQLKTWKPHHGDSNTERCALCFFGLPRAYKTMVLPSIVQNFLIPNARHNCDIFVHFFEQYSEEAGRRNRGGKVDPHDILLLEEAAIQVHRQYGPTHGRDAHRAPSISFAFDTEAQFWEKRGPALEKYHTAVNDDGRPAYFPYAAKTYTNSSLDNIVKQWHSVELAFKLMELTARQTNVTYSRVGMFRSDVMFLTPIDVAVLDHTTGVVDTTNRYITTAPFGRMPVNDRMIYGPYEAVKIWSTQRFAKLEDRVKARKDPGYEMHSERFLDAIIFPMIAKLGVQMNINRHCCFVRTRSDESAIVSDCGKSGHTADWGKVNKKYLVEEIVNRNCTFYKMGHQWTSVGCGEGIKYYDGVT